MIRRSDLPESVIVTLEKTYARTGDMTQALVAALNEWPGAWVDPKRYAYRRIVLIVPPK